MNFLYKIIFIRSMLWLPVVIAFLTFGGCLKVGPDYVRPEISVYKEWHTQLKGDPTAKEMDPQTLATWWTTLNDPKLFSLIKRAAEGNLDLKKAQARIREARARRGVAISDLFPTLDATGKFSRSRSSEAAGSGMTSNLYAVGFDAGWELDIFGGVRRSVEVAEANLQYSEEDRRDVLVSLLSEVALNYTEVRTYQTRLGVAEANLNAQKETYQLTSWR